MRNADLDMSDVIADGERMAREADEQDWLDLLHRVGARQLYSHSCRVVNPRCDDRNTGY
jgi:hypothetical protein